jgi:hypothetical protein
VAEAQRRAAAPVAEDAGPAVGEPGGGVGPSHPWGAARAVPAPGFAEVASGDVHVLLEGYFGSPAEGLGDEYGAVPAGGEAATVGGSAASAGPAPDLAEVASGDAHVLLEGYFGSLAEGLGDEYGAVPVGGAGATVGGSYATAWTEADSGLAEPALQVPEVGTLAPEFPNPAPGAPDQTAPANGLVPVATTAGAWLPQLGRLAESGAAGGAEWEPPAGEERGPQAGEQPAGAPDGASGGLPLLSLSSSALAGAPGLLEVHAEVHVFGWARPGSRLRVFGRPVALRPDGSFSVRRPLPEGALVLPLELLPPAEDSEAGPD